MLGPGWLSSCGVGLASPGVGLASPRVGLSSSGVGFSSPGVEQSSSEALRCVSVGMLAFPAAGSSVSDDVDALSAGGRARCLGTQCVLKAIDSRRVGHGATSRVAGSWREGGVVSSGVGAAESGAGDVCDGDGGALARPGNATAESGGATRRVGWCEWVSQRSGSKPGGARH